MGRLFVRVAAVLVCAAGVAVSVTSRDSRIAAEDAYGYWSRTGDSRGTLERIHRARRLNPSYELDLAEARALPPAQGEAVLRRALRREPENAELWVGLAQVRARRADLPSAIRAYTRAQALAPAFLKPEKAPGG